jgi:putative hydrolase of the HAD superfamily
MQTHNDDPRRLGLGHVDAWVFDLDNTLYPASSSLFPQIDVRMRQFIAQRLGMELDDAYRLQKRYYREFGTTLRGLMIRHAIEPDAFLSYVHDIDCTVLDVAPRLDAALERLRGRKLIFTNGSERHAVNVLARLGITRHFEGVFDIAAAGFIPKPEPATYRLMLERHAVDPRAAAMLEDIQRNLVPAAAAGMTTVWVREDNHPDAAHEPEPVDLSHIHHITDDLTAWLEGVR